MEISIFRYDNGYTVSITQFNGFRMSFVCTSEEDLRGRMQTLIGGFYADTPKPSAGNPPEAL